METRKRLNWPKIRAWLVHFYTSSGLITGFLALYAIFIGNPKLTFFWLGVALVIDATDGTLARKFKISYWTPEFDGRKLDDITDYINYAFLPVFFMWRFDLISGLWILMIPLVLISSVYGFCQSDAKTNDGYFTGFPNFWNLVALYLFTFQWPGFINGIILVILSILIFMPFKFVSFSTPGKVKLAKSLSIVYFVLLILTVINASQMIAIISLIFPILYFGYALYLKVNELKFVALVDS